MAPMAPIGRDGAIKLVEAGRFPISFGSPHPTVAIVEEDGLFRIRRLVIDEAEASEAGRAAIAAGRGWMPENYYALGKPTGEVFAEATSREGLIEKMRTMKWPRDW